MTKKNLSALKSFLQSGEPKALERLASDLISKLIGVRITVARSGFQSGADAGTVGRADRHLRIECKRYADTSPLDDRNLQGEIDDALRRDSALEAWILVSTRGVSQQTEDCLYAKAMTTGVPVIVIDWCDDSEELPTLAALCAWAPDVVEKHFGRAAKAKAKALASMAEPIVERLGRELSPWAIGYQSLLTYSQERFARLWSSALESKSVFGQNVAGGTVPTILRQSVSSGLDSWWRSDAEGIVVVHGAEGMGKTWAAVQWAGGRLDHLPIYLMLSSSTFKELRGATQASIVEFIGDALYELNSVNTSDRRSYWHTRVKRLLARPPEEGPALLLLVDGLNQEPSVEWIRVLQVLEGEAFRGRVRTVVTTQTHFLQDRLRDLKQLSLPSTKLEVGRYDLSQGGEFDTLLQLHGLSRANLSAGVIELARVPRLFDLAVRQKADALLQGEPTVGRLLWAHARNELGLRANDTLSEHNWEEWLRELATRYQQDMCAENALKNAGPAYSSRELGDMVRDPAGSPDETARRLNEIVSGTWLEPVVGLSGRLRPTDTTIHLALGIAVLGALESAEQTSREKAAQVLDEYLDAVRATSDAAKLLAFALSVLVEKKWSQSSVVPELVLSALLQSQNAIDEQRLQAVHMAPALVHPLLHVVENSHGRASASARHWALVALKGIPAQNVGAWTSITNRMVDWVAHVTCPAPEKVASGDEGAKHQAHQLIDRIGSATPGVHKVLGVPVRLHEWERVDLGEYIPQLLIGKPLVSARKVLVAAAVAASVGYAGKTWAGLKWLVMFNPIDRRELQADLAHLSDVVTLLDLEAGIQPNFASAVSGMLLWLTGDEALERKANSQRCVPTNQISYSQGYLKDPAGSLFALERRHLDLMWADSRTFVSRKLQRIDSFLLDPQLPVPPAVVREVHEWGDALDVGAMSSGSHYGSGDYDLDSFLSLAAPVAPQAVEDLVTRWFSSLHDRHDDRRHWAATTIKRFALIAGPNEVRAIQEMRVRRPDNPSKDEPVLLLNMLEGELLTTPLDAQLDAVVTERDAFISISLNEVIRPPEAQTVRNFIHRWGLENGRAVEVLWNYLWTYPTPLDVDLFEQLAPLATSKPSEHQTIAFMALGRCNPELFGQVLLDVGWSALLAENEKLQDAGSKAVLAAAANRPLADLLDLVAPWCLLEEAARRGSSTADLEVAIQAIDRSLLLNEKSLFPHVARISVDAAGTQNYVSVEPNLNNPENDDGFESFDPDVRWASHQAAREKGLAYLKDAKSAGAVMTTRVVSIEAVRMLVQRCPASVSKWLEGLEEVTPALIARINAAGGLYLALCETLLEADPTRGLSLWHVLREHLRIAFVGVGALNELLLMAFRLRGNPAGLELKRHLYSLSQNTSDKSYQDLALAAVSQGDVAWLEAAIAEDEAAIEPFRQKRAIMVRGFLPPGLTYQPTWREGEVVGSWNALRVRAQETKNRAYCARYWWRRFLTALTPLDAFCSWQVFLSCVDNMAWAWMDSDAEALQEANELWRLKMLHWRINVWRIKQAIDESRRKGSSSIDKHLVGWDNPDEWLSQDALLGLGY